uniref:phosphatidylinositol-3,4,5-trisphosphate 5-phosphatase n=1 Tax=Denticeps clupeoides TaxID=299321 RepID=A0AAY4D8B7_9TELE
MTGLCDGMRSPAAWYHRDISRVLAEDLLARAGRDGSFLVRDSESVPGAYALCLLFQCHVHTYRILPDADGLLAVQTSQGVQVNCFRTLADLVLGYQQPHKGLVIPLLYPVGRETEPADESSGVLASEAAGLLTEYLYGDVNQDLESLRRGAGSLSHLQHMLSTVCQGLHRFGMRYLDHSLPQKCEAFCHLLQLMKSRHSKQQEPDVISVFVGTWNMGGSPPPRNLQSWMTCCGLGRTLDESVAAVPHDVYALGTQEHAQGEKEWSEQIRATLKSVTNIDFKQVAVQSLWNIRLLVFVKPEYGSRISHVSTASVKTGLGNTLGSKGAVGISFFLGESSLGFVNCHLTSGSEKVLRRNQNILDVLRLLSLGDKQLGTFDISLRFTHLFWCGDLNYRLDLDVQDILKHVSKREFDELMCSDQLTRERHKRKAFFNFKEERITFPPTYQYERGSRDCYLWQKYKTSGVRINVPSWCDRVLWRSYPETHIMCTSYDMDAEPHEAVFVVWEIVPFSRRLVMQWLLELFLFFYPSCTEVRRTSENDLQSCDVPGFLKLGWSSKHLPKLQPIISDLEFLKDQHLLLSVKSSDGFESYGECCLALRSLITTAAQPFETFLTHRGEEMGSIRGWVKVHVPPDRRQTRVRSYGGSALLPFQFHATHSYLVFVPFLLSLPSLQFYVAFPSDFHMADPNLSTCGTGKTD